MTPAIKSIQFHLTVEIAIEALAEELGMSVDGLIELWDRGGLQEQLDAERIAQLITNEGGWDEYGGFKVGSGTL